MQWLSALAGVLTGIATCLNVHTTPEARAHGEYKASRAASSPLPEARRRPYVEALGSLLLGTPNPHSDPALRLKKAEGRTGRAVTQMVRRSRTERPNITCRKVLPTHILDAPGITHSFYTQLLAGGEDGKLVVAIGEVAYFYNIKTSTIEYHVDPCRGEILTAVSRLGNDHFACGSTTGGIALVNVLSGRVARLPDEDQQGWGEVCSLTSVGGSRFCAGAMDGTVLLCGIRERRLRVLDRYREPMGKVPVGIVLLRAIPP